MRIKFSKFEKKLLYHRTPWDGFLILRLNVTNFKIELNPDWSVFSLILFRYFQNHKLSLVELASLDKLDFISLKEASMKNIRTYYNNNFNSLFL